MEKITQQYVGNIKSQYEETIQKHSSKLGAILLMLFIASIVFIRIGRNIPLIGRVVDNVLMILRIAIAIIHILFSRKISKDQFDMQINSVITIFMIIDTILNIILLIAQLFVK